MIVTVFKRAELCTINYKNVVRGEMYINCL